MSELINKNDSVTVDLDQYKDMDWDLLVSSGDGGKDVLQFIPRNDDGKRFHILSTIEMIRKVVETDPEFDHLFKKLLDKVCHTAPEILHLRWNDIYRFCLHHFGNIDEENGWSRQILHIYNSRIKQYNALFK